ncbi:Uncharacterised protein [Mycobacteroides abscessus subsp. massiliense]|nr:Uncharacterised protein [Mycobacteroides abscessus subsp. massiliense]
MQGRDSVGQTVFDDGPRLDRTDQAVEQPPRVGCYGYVDVLEQLDAFLDGFLVEGVAVRGDGVIRGVSEEPIDDGGEFGLVECCGHEPRIDATSRLI